MGGSKKQEGSEGSGSPVDYPAKQEATRSPVARGARGGNSARGACAFPYRNEQRVEAKAMPTAMNEVADRTEGQT